MRNEFGSDDFSPSMDDAVCATTALQVWLPSLAVAVAVVGPLNPRALVAAKHCSRRDLQPWRWTTTRTLRPPRAGVTTMWTSAPSSFVACPTHSPTPRSFTFSPASSLPPPCHGSKFGVLTAFSGLIFQLADYFSAVGPVRNCFIVKRKGALHLGFVEYFRVLRFRVLGSGFMSVHEL